MRPRRRPHRPRPNPAPAPAVGVPGAASLDVGTFGTPAAPDTIYYDLRVRGPDGRVAWLVSLHVGAHVAMNDGSVAWQPARVAVEVSRLRPRRVLPPLRLVGWLHPDGAVTWDRGTSARQIRPWRMAIDQLLAWQGAGMAEGSYAVAAPPRARPNPWRGRRRARRNPTGVPAVLEARWTSPSKRTLSLDLRAPGVGAFALRAGIDDGGPSFGAPAYPELAGRVRAFDFSASTPGEPHRFLRGLIARATGGKLWTDPPNAVALEAYGALLDRMLAWAEDSALWPEAGETRAFDLVLR